ncbi:urea transporter [Corynebacterium halotolerans]|uniref:Urea transporter n=1 Tax=Corynebacterium halotolerans YIM 70093 = DSM 44683 TaxID=1121362 RepID=M1NU04_9CORY|nr:urea transporter [Corynebacterium halotolerans]AGF72952.1 urea transporter [Corynebacterium halotolerans YIM 70093 = DSM 44683]
MPTTLSPVQYVLRGVSQIFFVENSVSGLLILVGLSFMDPRFAVLVMLGSMVQSIGGWFLGLREEVRHGLMGYNGALVGAAAGLYAGYTHVSVLLTIVGSFACVAVHELTRALFASSVLSRFSLPVSTAPFCIVAGLTFGAVGQLAEPGELSTSTDLAAGVSLGLFNSFSEVLLADGLVCGLLIVAALLLCSPAAAGFGVGGAAVALAVATVVRGGVDETSSGLYGYSAVLVTIALGALLWTDRSWAVRVLGSFIGVVLTLLIQPLLALTPVPVFTWPFLLAMWLVLVGDHLLVSARRPVTSEAPDQTSVEPADRSIERDSDQSSASTSENAQ